MAHKKAGSSKATQKGNVAGKRLGIKVPGDATVKVGQIIVRQRGRNFVPGKNVRMGSDFTVYSMIDGKVEFAYKSKNKKKINVLA